MDLDLMQTQGMPVDWFDPDQLKEGAYLTAGSGGTALINKAPHANAAKVGAQLAALARRADALSADFTTGEEGPDSLRIDIPKDKVPRGNRRPGTRMKPAIHSSTAPSGWIRSRSVSSSRKCWNSGESDLGSPIG